MGGGTVEEPQYLAPCAVAVTCERTRFSGRRFSPPETSDLHPSPNPSPHPNATHQSPFHSFVVYTLAASTPEARLSYW